MDNDNSQNTISSEISNVAGHFLPDNLLIQGIEDLIQMKDSVIELDNALVSLAQSSSFSAAELKNVTEEAFRLGEAAGKTGIEVLSYVTSAVQAGYGMQDALALTEEALKMSNISPGIASAEEALGLLKNILDGFGENASFASSINDALTGISGTGAVSFDTLAAASSSLAKAAGEAGLSFEEMLGLLTGAYDSLGDMEQVTSGELALFSNLKESYGEAKNLYNVLENLNSVWNTLDGPSRESFAVSTAGEGQMELFTALMDNWQGVEEAVISASSSFGAANAENARYMDSIAGKTAEFQNQVQELSTSLVDSGLVKFFLDLGTTGVNALNALTDKFGALGVLGGLTGGYLTSKNLGRANTDSCPCFHSNMPSLARFCWIQLFCAGGRGIHG